MYSLTNLPTFIVPGGKVQGTINDAPGTADDLWARWNYAVSINADTSGADTKKVGDYEFTFTLRNETTNTVLGSGTLEQGLLAFGVPQATIDLINNGSIYQDSINFKWLFQRRLIQMIRRPTRLQWMHAAEPMDRCCCPTRSK